MKNNFGNGHKIFPLGKKTEKKKKGNTMLFLPFNACHYFTSDSLRLSASPALLSAEVACLSILEFLGFSSMQLKLG